MNRRTVGSWLASFSLVFLACVIPPLRSAIADEPPPSKVEARPVTQSIKLFNGRDLAGFRSYLKDSGREDPRQVFSVVDGQIRISGESAGYLATDREYRDYLLTLEYRVLADLSPLFDIGGAVAEHVMPQLVALLGHPPESYGKGAIVGVNGDMEHGGALCHPKMGKPMRAALGGGKAVIPSNVKVAAAGATIDLPLGHKDNVWSFDHFDTITVGLADAPRPDEIVVIVGIADGGRVNPRVGQGPVT